MLGDTVFVTPVLSRLRSTFPGAEVHVALGKHVASLLRNLPLDEVHEFQFGRSLIREILAYLRLRSQHFDVVLILETNSHFTLMARLLGAGKLAGYENKLGSMLDYTVAWDQRKHFVDNAVGAVREWTTGTDRPWLIVSDREERDAREWLDAAGVPQGKPIVCMHPWTSVYRATRQWDPGRYAPLADALIERFDCAVVYSGHFSDSGRNDQVRAVMRHPSVNLAGYGSMREILAVMKLSSLVIGPDTGILHMATGVQTPVLMIMGETDPVRTGPYDPGGLSRMLRFELPCSPCFERTPKPVQWETCKRVWPVVCMQQLSVETVYKAAEEILIRRLAWAGTSHVGQVL